MQKILPLFIAVSFLTACVPKSEHEKVQKDLKAQIVQLNQELTKAKQVQENLDKAKGEIESIHADMAKAKADADNSRIEIERLRADLAKAKSDTESSRAELAKVKDEFFSASSALSKAQTELAKKPALPVKIGYRAALVAGSQVLRITNFSGEALPVLLMIKRPATGKTFEKELVLRTDLAAEFGHLEGWAFIAGDVITLKNNGYEVFETVANFK